MVRDGGRIVTAAFLVAIAANERGEREVLGCTVAAAESEASWTAFLRSLVGRGLTGVRRVPPDALARAIVAHPDEAAARAQLRSVAERLATSFPKAAEILLAAEDDVLAYLACPREHWTKIWSTNPPH